jgi:hypothetical protein
VSSVSFLFPFIILFVLSIFALFLELRSDNPEFSEAARKSENIKKDSKNLKGVPF